MRDEVRRSRPLIKEWMSRDTGEVRLGLGFFSICFCVRYSCYFGGLGLNV